MTDNSDRDNCTFQGYFNQLSFNPSTQNASINTKAVSYPTLFDHLYANGIANNLFLSIEFDQDRLTGNLSFDNKQDFYSTDYIAADMFDLRYYVDDISWYADDAYANRGNFVRLSSLLISHGIVDYDKNLRKYTIPIFQTSDSYYLPTSVDVDHYALALPETYFSSVLNFYQATYNTTYNAYVFDCNLFNSQKDYLSLSIDGTYLNSSDSSSTVRRIVDIPLANFVTIETNVTTYSNTSFKDYALFQTKVCYFDNAKFVKSDTEYATLGQVILSSLKFAYDFDKSKFIFGQLYNDTHYSTIKYTSN